LLVHLNPPVMFGNVAIPIEFDAAWMESVGRSELPAGWTEEPPPPATKRIGDLWVKEARSALLEVPGAVIRSDRNHLLNPAHPDFGRIEFGKAVPLAFDPRLLWTSRPPSDPPPLGAGDGRPHHRPAAHRGFPQPAHPRLRRGG
jgi:hypothetical protein